MKFRKSSFSAFFLIWAIKNFKWMTDFWGVFWFSLTIYTQQRCFCTVSYEKKTFRRIIALYHVGKHRSLSKMPFSLIKAMDLQLFVLKLINLTLIYIFDIIFFQEEMYIKSYIKTTKICYFLSFNIKLRENCVVLGKSEDNIVLRTQFHSRVC